MTSSKQQPETPAEKDLVWILQHCGVDNWNRCGAKAVAFDTCAVVRRLLPKLNPTSCTATQAGTIMVRTKSAVVEIGITKFTWTSLNSDRVQRGTVDDLLRRYFMV